MTKPDRLRRLAAWIRLCGPDLLALSALVAVALLVWYFRVLRSAHVPFELLTNADLYTQIYPMWLRIAEWWRDGIVPLWNPYQYAGHPVLACAIYGVLYPPNLVYWFVEPSLAIEMLAVGHVILAGASMYVFTATIGLRRPACFAAGATFMLSGYLMLQAVWFSPAIAAAAWLPVMLLAVEWLFRRADPLSAVLLAAAVALPFLAGWPQIWVYEMYIVVAYGLGRLVVAARSQEERRRLPRVAFLGAGAALLALAWMAPQLLPSLELQALGPRRTGGLSASQTGGPLPASWLLANLVDSGPGPPTWAYLGIGAVLLMPLSLAAARQRWRVVCFAALAAFAWTAVTAIESPAHALYRLIGGAGFRAPPRLLYVYTAAAAILAAVGVHVLAGVAERPASAAGGRRSERLRFGIAGGLALVAIVLVAGLPMPPLARLHLAGMLALASATILAPWARARRLALAGLVAWMVVDLGMALENPFMHPVQNRYVYQRYAAAFGHVAERQNLDRTYIVSRVDVPELMSKQGTLRRIYSITDYEPLSLERFGHVFRVMEPPSQQRPDWLTFTGALHADARRPHFQLLDLFSVRFVVLDRSKFGIDGADEALARLAPKWRRTLATEQGAIVYENSDPLPRAYLAPHAETARSPDAALAALTSLVFDPRRSVIVEHDGGAARGAPAPTPVVPAKIVRYEPTRVEIEVDAPSAGWLVLTDTHFPGWEAAVDGAAAPIVPANYLFRGVWVESGARRVEFVYRPRSVRLGAAAAAAGFVSAGAALAWQWRRRQDA